jgi:chromosome segregation ATPase
MGRGEQLFREVAEARDELKILQQQVASSLVDVGIACEKVATARERAAECGQLAGRFATSTAAGKELVERLSDVLAAADPLHDSLAETVADARDRLEQVQGLGRSVDQWVAQLHEGGFQCDRVIEQVEAATTAAEAAGLTARQEVDRLIEAEARSGKLANELTAVVESAGQLHEALEGLVAHAEEKVGRLTSHHAAASQVLQQLSTANVAGHSVIERTEQSKHAVEQALDAARSQVDRLIQDVWSLTTTSETNSRELSRKSQEVGELLNRLEASTAPASQLETRLAEQTELSQRHAASLAEDCAKAGGLVERLGAITRVLTAAKETGASIQRSVDQAQALRDELDGLIDRAGEQYSTLDELHRSSEGLIENHQQMTHETEASMHRLTAQFDSVESSQRLIGELLGQADSVRQELERQRLQATEIEAKLAEATAKPATVLDAAQAQAVQLDRVCGAVRKVFAGLSQATLEAKKHIEEFRHAQGEANGCLSQLATQTNRASNTLHQWVEEAVRAQSRLEQTLLRCPTIQETHSSDAMRVLAGTPPQSRLTSSTRRGELSMLPFPVDEDSSPLGPSEPAIGSPESPVGHLSSAVSKPVSRADEISRLIADAKQAEARQPQTAGAV